jgi:outer membrane protein assembly factor BamB/formylglycine-generating enzyme required for sulfatase activity
MNMFIFFQIARGLRTGDCVNMKNCILILFLSFVSGILMAGNNLPVIDFGDDYAWHGGIRGLPIYRAERATHLYKGSREGDNPVDVDGDGDTDDDSLVYYPFSMEEPLNPEGSFYNYKGMNSRFYGGLVTFFANKKPKWTEGGINIDHNLRDDFNLHSYATEGGEIGLRTFGLWVWQKEDFLNGGDQTPVFFDEGSELGVFISRYWKDYKEGRFVVRNKDQFYISEKTLGGSLHTLYTVSPLETRWAEYTPRAPYHIEFDPDTADFQSRTFDDVTAAGWWIAQPDLGPASLWVKWYAFSMKARVRDNKEAPAGPFPVNYGLWRRVYRWGNRNQTGIYRPYVWDRDGDMGDMATGAGPWNHGQPVTDITALDALAWCNALSEYQGVEPVFYSDPAFTNVFRVVLDRQDDAKRDIRPDVYVKWEATGYRPVLPGEGGGGDAALYVKRSNGTPPVNPDQALAIWNRSIQPATLPAQVPPPAIPMVALAGGSYPHDNGSQVRIAPLEMARTETTYDQWRRVYAWAVSQGYSFDRDGDVGSMDWSEAGTVFRKDEPVTQVSHLDAMLFCNALSEMEGRTPAYYTDQAKTQIMRSARRFRLETSPREISHHRIKDKGTQPIFTRWEVDGYRLPSQWEWEYAYAAGADSTEGYPWDGAATDHAWIGENSGDRTHPVAQKAANAFGLYDMAGNVFEWTMGGGGSYYLVDNPRGKGLPVPLGGSFRTAGPEVKLLLSIGGSPRVAIHFPLAKAYPEIGFRVVRCEAGVHPEEPPPYVPEKVLLDIPNQNGMQGKLWRGNVGRTGEFNAPGPLAEPSKAWSYDVGAPVKSSPVVVDGVVYLGADNGQFVALDQATGIPRWTYNAGRGIRSSAAVLDGRVFFSHGGGVVALDIETGQEIWKTSRGMWDDSPLVLEGPIPHRNGSTLEGIIFSSVPWDGMIGLDVATGEEVWKYRDGHGPGRLGNSAFFHEGLIGFFRGSQATVLVNADTERRNYEIDGAIDNGVFTPAARDGVAVAYIVGVAAFDLEENMGIKGNHHNNYNLKWRFLPQGNKAWDTQHPGTSSFAIDDQRVYFGHRDENVYALNRETGDVMWKTNTGGVNRSSPALGSADLLFIGSYNGNLYAMDKADGSIRWSVPVGGAIHSSPVLDGGMVVVGSDAGTVTAWK